MARVLGVMCAAALAVLALAGGAVDTASAGPTAAKTYVVVFDGNTSTDGTYAVESTYAVLCTYAVGGN